MLEVGETIRYRGLGAGTVVEHAQRRFDGSDRTFAIVDFAHRDLRAHIPIGDESVNAKLEKVASKTSLQRMLREMSKRGRVLPRTWDAREEIGQHALSHGGPEEWIDLLASYARAEGAGVSVAASDYEIVRQALDIVAAELACAAAIEFDAAEELVEKAYAKAVSASTARHSEPAEHFAAVLKA